MAKIRELLIDSDGSMLIPRGDTLPSGNEGELFYNTNTDALYAHNGDWVKIGPCNGAGTFGADFGTENSLAESSTISTSYQNKIDKTFSSLTDGATYLVMAEYAVKTSAGTLSHCVEVASTKYNEVTDAANTYYIHQSFIKTETISGTSLNVKVKYLASSGNTAYISYARVRIWRVN